MAGIASAIAVGGAWTAVAQAPSSLSCEASRVVGEATLGRGGRMTPLRAGMTVAQSDEVATARDSRLEIACNDGSRLVLGADSRIRLARFAGASPQPSGLVELLGGIARFALPSAHRWAGFDVVTRTAVASVRSTAWIVEATPERSSVFVAEGGVLVSSRANQTQVFLQQGEGVDVGTGPAPLQATRWGQARADDVIARTRLP